MKTYIVLMMAVISILPMVVSAQNIVNGNQQGQSFRSKKELMKMEVMKIIPISVTEQNKSYTSGTVSSLSLKERMKASVVKSGPIVQYLSIIKNVSGKCTTCLKMSFLSIKEQMKMSVIGLDSCPVPMGISDLQANKCTVCDMDVTACN